MACQVFPSDPPRSLMGEGQSLKTSGGYDTKHLKAVVVSEHSGYDHETVSYGRRKQWTVTCTDLQGQKAGYFTCNSPTAARKSMLRARNEGLLVKVSPPLPDNLKGIHPAVVRSDQERSAFRQANNPVLIKWRKERGY